MSALPEWIEPMAATLTQERFTGPEWLFELVVQVAFMEWTRHGKLRHPRLIGVRDDKAARDVVREQ